MSTALYLERPLMVTFHCYSTVYGFIATFWLYGLSTTLKWVMLPTVLLLGFMEFVRSKEGKGSFLLSLVVSAGSIGVVALFLQSVPILFEGGPTVLFVMQIVGWIWWLVAIYDLATNDTKKSKKD